MRVRTAGLSASIIVRLKMAVLELFSLWPPFYDSDGPGEAWNGSVRTRGPSLRPDGVRTVPTARAWNPRVGKGVNPSECAMRMAVLAYRRDRPGLCRALAGLPEPSQGSPGWPGGPRGRTSHLSHQTAGLTRTGAIGSQLLSHGVSAVEQTVPVCRLRPSLRPRRRFDRSIGPSESQRAVPKSVRVVRPLPLASGRGRSRRP